MKGHKTWFIILIKVQGCIQQPKNMTTTRTNCLVS